MRKYLILIVFSLLTLSGFNSYAQLSDPGCSNTRSYICAISYIEAFNNKNPKQLSNFFITYYKNPDLNKKIELEKSLQKRWGKIELIQTSYNSENEIILLMQASKLPDSYLIFDIKLRDYLPGKIEYFTRTGINKPENLNGIPQDQQVLSIADRSVPVNDSVIKQTTYEIAKAYDTFYFIPEIGGNISEILQENQKRGKYDQMTKAGMLADSIKWDILKIHFDLHSWVEANRRMLPYDSIEGPLQNFGFEEFKIIDGNLGYLKMNEFSPLKEARAFASHILDSLSDCKALIIDLRDNHGGYPEMIQFLSSYFFSMPTKINTYYDRNGNIVDELWTLDSIPGKRFNDSIPVIILTSNRTASAAEGFTDFFKRNKRAVIIGDITNGARHPAKEIVINSLFVVSIPYLRGNESGLMEGEGIVPDIHIPSESALEKAVEYAGNFPND